MITFEKTILKSEIEYGIITFTQEYASFLPHSSEEITIIDSDKKEYKKKMHSSKQLRIDSFGEIYAKYNAKVGDIIEISFDSTKTGLIYIKFDSIEMAESEAEDNDETEGSSSYLSKSQILKITNAIKELKIWIDKNREENLDIYQYIQYPKIPSKLSEAFIIHLIQDKLILKERNLTDCQLGGGADIIAKDGRKTIKIEVKATTADFQQLTDKDTKADYLIWINLKNVFKSLVNNNSFDVYIIDPKEYGIKKGKITLKQFQEKIAKEADYVGTNFIEYLSK